jgi:hypothetical protein
MEGIVSFFEHIVTEIVAAKPNLSSISTKYNFGYFNYKLGYNFPC